MLLVGEKRIGLAVKKELPDRRGGASTPSSGRGRTPSSSLGVPEVSADENSNEKNRHYHLPGEPAGDRLSGRPSRRDA
ncbi:hypothetical protein B296_00015939 [Ensete ventricosum]|uniref:Uncharacterized protein n=1 Tax=Ensete ventricosum TaxID=4639 RepID=A0A426YNJ1_ENSVE|nr:hypothetical protein B296_00015939 [Ensete ventricosum]